MPVSDGSVRGDGVAGAAAQLALRVSHADRDQVVEVLRIAAGDGRLTAEELDERVEAALTARTAGDLAVLTADLPTGAGVGAAGAKDVVRIEQEGASTRRGEGWVVPRRMEVRSTWGEVTLDFTQAVITHDTLHLDLDIRGGALKVLTRPGVVVDTDALVTNYARVKTRRTGAAPGAPVVLRVMVTGELNLGQVVVRPPRWFGR
ncbi:DUF1707 domain-containing protein [Streptomyces sp. ALI-76-A]|jgi:hypothetical protein|uniref:DUF1707 SHOCT-like domain-containing protein n=1 Tax=Streptomyces sp. ALI-76-A TaxID=3025736 RepID=UPI00256ED486|nr:DUF1707 domain-containing protein [Streptomyces sp. ALI-76-A]MDL5200276.1 DUF1707 domain-containing protein [Streptomyces sp. ALI-76-A]